MSRTTSSPLPDMANLPDDFIDHLVLVTAGLANSLPPPAIRRFLDPNNNINTSHFNGNPNPHSSTSYHDQSTALKKDPSSEIGNGNGMESDLKSLNKQTEEMDINGNNGGGGGGHRHTQSFSSAFSEPAPPSPKSDYETADGHTNQDSSTTTTTTTSTTTPTEGHFTSSGLPQSSINNHNTISPPSSHQGVVSIPLPRFHFDGGDSRTQQIESNIGKLVERLWRAEDKLESIALASRRGSAVNTESGDSVGTAREDLRERRSSVDVEVQTVNSVLGGNSLGGGGGATIDPSSNHQDSSSSTSISNPTTKELNSTGTSTGSSSTTTTSTDQNGKSIPLSFFPNFPYPLSHAHPQSSTYPLSYPLGMGSDGPVLLTSGGDGTGPEGAVGAFERYSDESGLSAQEELRLLKAQVQDIARVCKVSCLVISFETEVEVKEEG